jgi:hypothetical protein
LEKQLAMIAPREAGVRVRRGFDLLRLSNRAFEATKEAFEKTREELYQWPSEIQRHQQYNPTLP